MAAMDERTIALLEFDRIRTLLADRAGSALGKERARILAPTVDVESARLSLDRTSEMVEAIGQRLSPPMGGLHDVRVHVRKSSLGVLLEIEQILEIRDVLELTARVREYTGRLAENFALLYELLRRVGDFGHISRQIETAIDERGLIRNHATPELANIRQAIAGHEERIQIELRRLLRSPEVRNALRYPNATMSGEHHVLPVAVNYRHVVQGIVHRSSGTGETLFVEPAKVAEISSEIAVLRSAELREIRKVLRRLTGIIAQEKDRILEALEILGELDLIHAKARLAADFEMHPPVLTTDGTLRMMRARHPILEDIFRSENRAKSADDKLLIADCGLRNEVQDSSIRAVVPIDVHLGDDFDLLVITGPNTGGKTVALKTVGLLCLMARCGLHVSTQPGSRVPFLSDILADIGDEQSLQQSLSTFSSHITRIKEILEKAGPNTLVLLDEMGAGTDPTEGAALGRALLDRLVKSGCRAMVTTHLGDLKTFAFSRPRVENAAVEFDVATLRPTFRLFIGQTGQSCALRIARRLKLPRDVVQRAERYLNRRQGRHGKEVTELEKVREQAEIAKQQAQAAQVEAERVVADYRKKTELLKQESAVSAELEKARASLRAGDTVRVPKFDKSGKIVRVDHRKGKAAVAVGAVEWQLTLDELVPFA